MFGLLSSRIAVTKVRGNQAMRSPMPDQPPRPCIVDVSRGDVCAGAVADGDGDGDAVVVAVVDAAVVAVVVVAVVAVVVAVAGRDGDGAAGKATGFPRFARFMVAQLRDTFK